MDGDRYAADGAGSNADGEEKGLWLDDAAGLGNGRRRRRLRQTGVVAAAVACLAVVGVPAGLVLTSGSGAPAALPPIRTHRSATRLGDGPAEHQVISALSATTDSGSFDFTYVLSATRPAAAPTSTACPDIAGPYTATVTVRGVVGASCAVTGRAVGNTTVVSGGGTIDTNPMGMLAGTNRGVSVRVDGTRVWEGGSGTGLVPSTTTPFTGAAKASYQIAVGTALPDFESTAEGALGTGPGAVAMMGMASPTGYLDLQQSAVTGAEQVGTGTVDGASVTQYKVSMNPTQLASAPDTTPEEVGTIASALKVLQQEGLTGIDATVSIDASGYIRASTSVASFSDGETVTLAGTYSDFGCAGTVLMPGQEGTATPPAGCVSPDTGLAPAPTTTTPAPTTTTPAPTTTTPAPTTTTPAPTTTTPAPTTTTPKASGTSSSARSTPSTG